MRGGAERRKLSHELEPDPRTHNGHDTGGTTKQLSANNLVGQGGTNDVAYGNCTCNSHTLGQSHEQRDTVHEQHLSPLMLHGARTEPSALLKVQGCVHGVSGVDVFVQPMIDSGASGMGFFDPDFVKRCGAVLQPCTRRIALADGSQVQASGKVRLTYSLTSQVCGSWGTSRHSPTPSAPSPVVRR